MEHLVGGGRAAGVVDYTLSELANSLMDGIHATGPERLRVAGRHGLPQVVVPGCCDFFNQGARDTVPERYRDRKSYFHNPVATLVRLSRRGGVELGRIVAERLDEVDRPVSRRRADARLLARRRRGRRPLGPGRRPRVPRRAARRAARRHPLRGGRRPRRRPRVRRPRRRPLPHPRQGARPCRMTVRPRTACSTSRRRTSRGSRSART